MLLVTAAQRSGTCYLATVLTEAGVEATHEGNPPGVGWRAHDPRTEPRTDVEVDVCWHSAWWLDQLLAAGHTVAHLVRHPLASIASSSARHTFDKPKPSGAWAIERIPEAGEGASLQRCAAYWVRWNQLIEHQSHTRLQVEHVDVDVLSGLLTLAGIDHDRDTLAKAVDTVPAGLNTNRHAAPALTWGDLGDDHLAHQARGMAARYGYAVDGDHGPPAASTPRGGASRSDRRRPASHLGPTR